MDEIEAGFEKIMQKIDETQKKEAALSDEMKKQETKLLAWMAQKAVPVIGIVGMNMLMMGKQDTKGEIYDPRYYPDKMIILGKTDPAATRPDAPGKEIVDQFCILSDQGKFFEMMYSFDGFITDSYLNPITPAKAIELYGYDIMFMLYKAMHDYLKGEEELVAALEKVLLLVFPQERK